MREPWRCFGIPFGDGAPTMMLTRRFVSSFTQRLAFALGVLLCSAMATSAWADPPGRGGRPGDLTGQAWVYSPRSREWVAAGRPPPPTGGGRPGPRNAAAPH